MKKSILEYITPETELTLILNPTIGKYNIAFKLDEITTYISNIVVTLGPRLRNVDLSSLTEDHIYTVGQTGRDSSGQPIDVFVDFSGRNIVQEYTFKITNLERFKIFKHLFID